MGERSNEGRVLLEGFRKHLGLKMVRDTQKFDRVVFIYKNFKHKTVPKVEDMEAEAAKRFRGNQVGYRLECP